MSDIANIADAITTSLQNADLGQPFTAVRTYTPVYDSVKQEGIRIFVVPASQQFDQATRSETQRTSTIYIGIFNAIGFDEYGSHDTTELDAMLGFTEKVCDYFLTNNQVTNPTAFIADVVNSPTFDPVSLDDRSTFATVVTLTTVLIR